MKRPGLVELQAFAARVEEDATRLADGLDPKRSRCRGNMHRTVQAAVVRRLDRMATDAREVAYILREAGGQL